jgi:phosphatidylserine/phosphatidylglycerophosphate/cardiolipin synthase-like enzyme
VAGLFEGASAGTLRSLAAAFRNGRLGADASPFSISNAASCPTAVRDRILGFCREGMAPTHLALLLETSAELVETRSAASTVELVWTGPETGPAHSRDTAVVLDQLFGHAERDVLISTFVVQQVATVFAPLAKRMEELPSLTARVFLHVGRGHGDTTAESELLREFGDRLASQWTSVRRPEVYYDPRGLQADGAVRATWHAKCVIVDGERSFVTSANFTEWAQQRNVEAGVLITSRSFAAQLRHQFDSLVAAKLVRRLPGW